MCDDYHMAWTVLVVDDHSAFRASARRLLELDGFQVVGEAADAESALRLTRELRPQLVLLDIGLPDGSGFEVAEQLARDPVRVRPRLQSRPGGPRAARRGERRDRLHLQGAALRRGDPRPARPGGMRALRAVLAAAGVVLGVLAYRVQIDNLDTLTSPIRATAIVAVAWAFLGAGLIAWARRPENRLGPLLTAAGFALLARQFRYSHDPLAFTVFFAVGELSYALVAHSVLAYPSGHVRGRAERALVYVGYASMLLFPLAVLLLYDGTTRLRFMDSRPHESLLVAWENGSLALAVQRFFVFFVGHPRHPLHRARRPPARACDASGAADARPLWLAAVVVAPPRRLRGDLRRSSTARPPSSTTSSSGGRSPGSSPFRSRSWPGCCARGSRARTWRSSCSSSSGAPPEGLRDALARALGDPGLELAFWLPERSEYVDARRPSADAPGRTATGRSRASTTTASRSRRIVHDASLADEPELLEAVGRRRAARARERAPARRDARAARRGAGVARRGSSRPADEERRRIERDLHDGAQQRLVALALQLRAAQRRLGAASTPKVERAPGGGGRRASGGRRGAARARPRRPPGDPHRGRARGGARVARAAGRRAVDARRRATGGSPARGRGGRLLRRLRGARERGQARERVDGRRSAPCAATASLVVEVADDGVGGADAADGSGLRGLADRVEALGGRLAVESPPGRRHPRRRGDPVRVVIAEDSVLLREGLARVLAEAGFEVVGAGRRRRRALPTRSRRTSPTSRSSTSACRRRRRTRAPARRATIRGASIPSVGDPPPLAGRRGPHALELFSEQPEGFGYLLKDRVLEVDDFLDARAARRRAAARRSTRRWSRSCSAGAAPTTRSPS